MPGYCARAVSVIRTGNADHAVRAGVPSLAPARAFSNASSIPFASRCAAPASPTRPAARSRSLASSSSNNVRGACRLIRSFIRRVIPAIWYPHGITSRGRSEAPGSRPAIRPAPRQPRYTCHRQCVSLTLASNVYNAHHEKHRPDPGTQGRRMGPGPRARLASRLQAYRPPRPYRRATPEGRISAPVWSPRSANKPACRRQLRSCAIPS